MQWSLVVAEIRVVVLHDLSGLLVVEPMVNFFGDRTDGSALCGKFFPKRLAITSFA